MPEKPQWMSDHELADQRSFDKLSETLERIEDKLDPLYDNYAAANKLGKWMMAVLLAISLVTGSIWAIWQVIHGSK